MGEIRKITDLEGTRTHRKVAKNPMGEIRKIKVLG